MWFWLAFFFKSSPFACISFIFFQAWNFDFECMRKYRCSLDIWILISSSYSIFATYTFEISGWPTQCWLRFTCFSPSVCLFSFFAGPRCHCRAASSCSSNIIFPFRLILVKLTLRVYCEHWTELVYTLYSSHFSSSSLPLTRFTVESLYVCVVALHVILFRFRFRFRFVHTAYSHTYNLIFGIHFLRYCHYAFWWLIQ